jgi:hypothetical protein
MTKYHFGEERERKKRKGKKNLQHEFLKLLHGLYQPKEGKKNLLRPV